MQKLLSPAYWHNLFKIGVALKALNGIWQTASGLFILLVSKETLSGWLSFIIQRELLENPNDGVIGFLTHSLQNISTSTQTFVGLYILLHGLLNLFLTIQLTRDRHWAYLVTIGVTALFVCYQVYRISVYHSLFLTVFTAFDILFIILTWHEYRYHQEKVTPVGVPVNDVEIR